MLHRQRFCRQKKDECFVQNHGHLYYSKYVFVLSTGGPRRRHKKGGRGGGKTAALPISMVTVNSQMLVSVLVAWRPPCGGATAGGG